MKINKIEIILLSFVIILLIVLFNLKPKENTEPFSLNMIDDVIHDKYEKNTDEYYKYRITRDENSLKTNS